MGSDHHRAAMTGGGAVVTALLDSQVSFTFGIPGTHNLELYEALSESSDITPILVTDERSAGFMADGVYRASGKLGALILVPGAGTTHALSGVAEAFMDQIPLVVLMCAPRDDIPFAYQLHDIDQGAMIRPVVKQLRRAKGSVQDVYNQIRHAADLAMADPKGPVAVELPAELLFATGAVDPAKRHPLPVEPVYGFNETSYQQIVARLKRATRIGLYLGLGARPAGPAALERLADMLDATVFTTISGKGVFAEEHPRFAANVMGRALAPALLALEKNCDLILAIGCRFAETATGSYGFNLADRLIHVDIDPEVLGRNYAAEITLKADGAQFIQRILAESSLARPQQSGITEALAEAQAQIRRGHEAADAAQTDVGLCAFFSALQAQFGPESIFACDSGNGLFKAMEMLRLPRQNSFLAPVDFSCMGYSVPAAIGAKLAAPGRPVIALIGDGALLMCGMEMVTAAHHNLGILFVVLADGKLAQIADFQRRTCGRESLTTLHDMDYRPLAAALGLSFLQLDTMAEIDKVVSEAHATIEHNRPVLLVVRADYSESTHFTKGVIQTNQRRLAYRELLRMGTRLLWRRLIKES